MKRTIKKSNKMLKWFSSFICPGDLTSPVIHSDLGVGQSPSPASRSSAPSISDNVNGKATKKTTKKDDELWMDLETQKKVDIQSPRGNKRIKFSKAQRCAVWNKHCGKDKANGPCFCCNQKVNFQDFHVGHVTSLASGGTNDIGNLVVLCPTCNLSMGKEEANEFRKNIHPDFSNVVCPNCSKTLLKKNFDKHYKKVHC